MFNKLGTVNFVFNKHIGYECSLYENKSGGQGIYFNIYNIDELINLLVKAKELFDEEN